MLSTEEKNKQAFQSNTNRPLFKRFRGMGPGEGGGILKLTSLNRSEAPSPANKQTDRQTRVITLPSRKTTYTDGKNNMSGGLAH